MSSTGHQESKTVDLEKGDRWLDDYLPYQLYRVTNRLNVRLQGRMRALDINLSQWRILSVLHSSGTLSISGIVEQTLMEQPTVSRVVVQLEKDGMVERRVSSEDSRMIDITLTPKGAETFTSIRQSAYAHERIALEGLPAETLDLFRETLRRIESNIDIYD